MNKRLITVGDLVLDLLLDVLLPAVADEHQTSRTLLIEPGGACSTILAARNLGLDVSALGAVGADFQGRMLREILGDAAVDLSALVTPAESSTTTVIALSDRQRGGHVFLGNYGGGAAIELNDSARSALARADAVFLPGYTLVDAGLSGLVAGLMAVLQNSAIPLYVDVGPFMGQLASERIATVLSLTDVLLLTEAEIPFVSPGAAGATGAEACRGLLQRYPNLLIVLKLAEAGCHLLARDVDMLCPGFAVDLVDTIGAGDAFAAAFIWAQLQGFALADCGSIANAMGAASVAKAGAGRNVPSCAELQGILDENETGIKLPC